MDALRKIADKAQDAVQGHSHQQQQQQQFGGDMMDKAGALFGGQHAAAPGMGAAMPGAAAGGNEFSSLASMASHFDSLDTNKDGNVDWRDFSGKFFGSAPVGQEKAEAAKSSGAIDQLLHMFSQQTGNKFTGNSNMEWDVLTQLAQSQTNIPFRKEILQQLVKWKMQSMF